MEKRWLPPFEKRGVGGMSMQPSAAMVGLGRGEGAESGFVTWKDICIWGEGGGDARLVRGGSDSAEMTSMYIVTNERERKNPP